MSSVSLFSPLLTQEVVVGIRQGPDRNLYVKETLSIDPYRLFLNSQRLESSTLDCTIIKYFL